MSQFQDIRFSLFFDRKNVTDENDRVERRALSRFGAFVRTDAMRSMRRRRRPSAPGQPPSKHDGRLARLIFFVYDAARSSVYIGPILFRGSSGAGRMTVSQIHEFGGRVSGSFRVPRRDRRPGQSRLVTVTGTGNYRQRPFMFPALDRTNEKFPSIISG